jgi:hypothetical protein
MADLDELNSSQSIKIAGADPSTGIETRWVDATTNGLKVDGSGVTQPISAASLPLPSGAATETTLSKITIAQGATTTGQSGNLNFGAVTTAAPTYTTGTVNNLSLTTAGALRVDGSASTQPVSGTITANIGTSGSLALDATLTGGTTKAIVRGGAKGTTTAADVTSTSVNANTQALDVNIAAGTITASSGPATGSVTQTSGTAGSASSTALASNASRKYLMIQNHSSRDMWFSFTGAATTAKPSLRLLAGQVFTMEGTYVSTQAVTTIRAGGNDADFTIIEGT